MKVLMKKTAAITLSLLLLLTAGGCRKPGVSGSQGSVGAETESQSGNTGDSGDKTSKTPSKASEKPKKLTDKDKEYYGKIKIGDITIAKTSYTSEEQVIITTNVVQFDAAGDGVTDDYTAFKNAISRCNVLGGGTVFVPKGIYYISYPLTIPKGVILRGEYEPGKHDAGGGTLIVTDYAIPEKTAFITMEQSSALKNISVYHKNQDFKNPQKMGATIGLANGVATTITLDNVMLYNPYIALDFATVHNGHLIVNNLHASPLSIGLISDQSSDVNRIYNVYFDSKYYANCGLEGAPKSNSDKQKLINTMRNNAIGFIVERNDAMQLYNVHTNDLHTGIICRATTNPANTSWKGPGGYVLYGFSIKNCKIGLQFEGTTYGGASAVNGQIQTLGDDALGIDLTEEFKTYVNLNGIKISGKPAYGMRNQGKGNISIINSEFKDWKDGNTAVKSTNGGLYIQQCSFMKKSAEIDAKGTKTIAVQGCTFASGKPSIDVTDIKPLNIFINHDSLNIPKAPTEMYAYAEKVPKAAKDKIYNVADYMKNDKNTSNHAVYIQQALDDAGKNGGGIVYLPPRTYNIRSSLSVPTGVELRGTGDYFVSLMSIRQTFFNVYCGEGTEDGALVTLAEKSGIRGITFNYPNQSKTGDYVKYPWVIQSKGKAVWAMDINTVNAWRAIDFGTYPSDGFYISNIIGQTLKTGIFAGNNSTIGRIENCHFTCAEWAYSGLPNRPDIVDDSGTGLNESGVGVNQKWTKFLRSLMEYNNNFVLGSNEKILMLGNASYGSSTAVRYIEQNGKFTKNVSHFMHYVDGAQNAITVEKAGTVNLYSPIFCCSFSEKEMNYVVLKKNCNANVNISNGFCHASQDTSYVIEGGTANIVQTGLFSFGNPIAKVSGGNMNLYCGLVFFISEVHTLATGGQTNMIGNIYYVYDVDNTKDAAVYEEKGGKVYAKGNVHTHKRPL